ncbi:hypothetical protein BdWA1_001963 [Babesia duncani]|uniref:Uncharacterized protein n=1 Tax=Babesia duncani TaxID=323732 RepID=A0AAD9PL42_9APIC|nr:hypothetical protein BdWA1_001963 [Babesia duncani]
MDLCFVYAFVILAYGVNGVAVPLDIIETTETGNIRKGLYGKEDNMKADESKNIEQIDLNGEGFIRFITATKGFCFDKITFNGTTLLPSLPRNCPKLVTWEYWNKMDFISFYIKSKRTSIKTIYQRTSKRNWTPIAKSEYGKLELMYKPRVTLDIDKVENIPRITLKQKKSGIDTSALVEISRVIFVTKIVDHGVTIIDLNTGDYVGSRFIQMITDGHNLYKRLCLWLLDSDGNIYKKNFVSYRIAYWDPIVLDRELKSWDKLVKKILTRFNRKENPLLVEEKKIEASEPIINLDNGASTSLRPPVRVDDGTMADAKQETVNADNTKGKSSAEKASSDTIEAPPTEAAVPDTIEAPPTEVAVPDTIEAPPTEAAVPDTIEDPSTEAAVPDTIEAPPTKEVFSVQDETTSPEGVANIDEMSCGISTSPEEKNVTIPRDEDYALLGNTLALDDKGQQNVMIGLVPMTRGLPTVVYRIYGSTLYDFMTYKGKRIELPKPVNVKEVVLEEWHSHPILTITGVDSGNIPVKERRMQKGTKWGILAEKDYRNLEIHNMPKSILNVDKHGENIGVEFSFHHDMNDGGIFNYRAHDYIYVIKVVTNDAIIFDIANEGMPTERIVEVKETITGKTICEITVKDSDDTTRKVIKIYDIKRGWISTDAIHKARDATIASGSEDNKVAANTTVPKVEEPVKKQGRGIGQYISEAWSGIQNRFSRHPNAANTKEKSSAEKASSDTIEAPPTEAAVPDTIEAPPTEAAVPDTIEAPPTEAAVPDTIEAPPTKEVFSVQDETTSPEGVANIDEMSCGISTSPEEKNVTIPRDEDYALLGNTLALDDKGQQNVMIGLVPMTRGLPTVVYRIYGSTLYDFMTYKGKRIELPKPVNVKEVVLEEWHSHPILTITGVDSGNIPVKERRMQKGTKWGILAEKDYRNLEIHNMPKSILNVDKHGENIGVEFSFHHDMNDGGIFNYRAHDYIYVIKVVTNDAIIFDIANEGMPTERIVEVKETITGKTICEITVKDSDDTTRKVIKIYDIKRGWISTDAIHKARDATIASGSEDNKVAANTTVPKVEEPVKKQGRGIGQYISEAWSGIQNRFSRHPNAANTKEKSSAEKASSDTIEAPPTEAAVPDTIEATPTEAAVPDTIEATPTEAAVPDTIEAPPTEAAVPDTIEAPPTKEVFSVQDETTSPEKLLNIDELESNDNICVNKYGIEGKVSIVKVEIDKTKGKYNSLKFLNSMVSVGQRGWILEYAVTYKWDNKTIITYGYIDEKGYQVKQHSRYNGAEWIPMELNEYENILYNEMPRLNLDISAKHAIDGVMSSWESDEYGEYIYFLGMVGPLIYIDKLMDTPKSIIYDFAVNAPRARFLRVALDSEKANPICAARYYHDSEIYIIFFISEKGEWRIMDEADEGIIEIFKRRLNGGHDLEYGKKPKILLSSTEKQPPSTSTEKSKDEEIKKQGRGIGQYISEAWSGIQPSQSVQELKGPFDNAIPSGLIEEHATKSHPISNIHVLSLDLLSENNDITSTRIRLPSDGFMDIIKVNPSIAYRILKLKGHLVAELNDDEYITDIIVERWSYSDIITYIYTCKGTQQCMRHVKRYENNWETFDTNQYQDYIYNQRPRTDVDISKEHVGDGIVVVKEMDTPIPFYFLNVNEHLVVGKVFDSEKLIVDLKEKLPKARLLRVKVMITPRQNQRYCYMFFSKNSDSVLWKFEKIGATWVFSGENTPFVSENVILPNQGPVEGKPVTVEPIPDKPSSPDEVTKNLRIEPNNKEDEESPSELSSGPLDNEDMQEDKEANAPSVPNHEIQDEADLLQKQESKAENNKKINELLLEDDEDVKSGDSFVLASFSFMFLATIVVV